MAANQDTDDDMEEITDMEDNEDLDGLLETLDRGDAANNMTARRRIEELLEERRLREQIEDYGDWVD